MFFYRASSLNSVYSDNSSATTSEPFNWLTVTLTKRELDKACKDSNHKIFSADFKVCSCFFFRLIESMSFIAFLFKQTTLYFTRPGLSAVGSLPANIDGAARNRNSLTVVPRYPTSANGSSRPKTIATTTNSSASVKLNSPQNLGLLGPICWRNSASTKAHDEVLLHSDVAFTPFVSLFWILNYFVGDFDSNSIHLITTRMVPLKVLVGMISCLATRIQARPGVQRMIAQMWKKQIKTNSRHHLT